MAIWSRLLFLLYLASSAFVIDAYGQTGDYIRPVHKYKSLTTSKLRLLADRSDQNYFRKHELEPMMRVRVPGTTGHEQVRGFINKKLQDFGWDVQEDTFEDMAPAPHGMKSFTNIIATSDPFAPSRLTLACHYDSKYFADFDFLGMSDSAVPCAILLDLARTLNSSLMSAPGFSETSLQFIFFDGEEAFIRWSDTDSLYGSRHLVQEMKSQPKDSILRELKITDLEKINCLVLLDLIGAAEPRFVNYFDNTKSLYEKLQKIEKRLIGDGLLEPAYLFSKSTNKYFTSRLPYSTIQDDHTPFLNEKVPILHLITSPFPSIWHSQNDNMDYYDPIATDNINKILRVFVAEYLHLKL